MTVLGKYETTRSIPFSVQLRETLPEMARV